MRIIARKTLSDFWQKHADAEQPLRAWMTEVKHATWNNTTDVRAVFGSADFVANNRIVFNIHGNTYRLIAHVRYDIGIVFIRFIGTHAEYNRIDAESI